MSMINFKDYKAGVYRQQFQHRSFSPTPANHGWRWEDPKITTLLEEARGALAELNAFSLIVPDVDMFIWMHVVKEARDSSGIEGTRTGMDEALMERELILPEKRDDWQEVQNYIKAMNQAIKELEQVPLSNRLLKQAHAILMQGVRGAHKAPGEFRTSQNWIGGASLTDAIFIPPHPEEVPALMGDLELFWHNSGIEVPDLIRIAISHYQFETIHPFLDGNGRIGRLLITLYLVNKGLLAKPSLYLSDHLLRHKPDYERVLTVVRTNNDINHWVKFFLVALRDTSIKGRNTFQQILKLRQEAEHKIASLGKKSGSAQRLLNAFYRKPMMTVKEMGENLKMTHPSVNALAQDFVKLGLLNEVTGYKRNRVFVFEEYYRLFLG
jgi:Fic family protein